MKITLEKAAEGFIAYMAEQVATIPNGINRWLGFGALGSLKNNPGLLINKVRPYLEMVAVVEDNMVDIEAARDFLNAAFSNEPKLSYFNFTFTADDAKALIAQLVKRAEE